VVGRGGKVLRTYSVSHRQPNLAPGTYRVYAKKATLAFEERQRLRYVLRMEQGKGGASQAGFCSVPLTRAGKPAKASTEAGLEGGAVSSPCIEQKLADAKFLYGKAPVGTRVVVIP
jgi:lipoprotein-anchoring transpeptidase ErfK/SrfK